MQILQNLLLALAEFCNNAKFPSWKTGKQILAHVVHLQIATSPETAGYLAVFYNIFPELGDK